MQSAAPFDPPGRPDVADDGAADREGIHARMKKEPVILDGDKRVLQVDGDVGERDVLAVLVHAEPSTPVRREEPGVADPASQLVDGPGLP